MIESETFTTASGYKKALGNLIIKISTKKKRARLLNIFLCDAELGSGLGYNEIEGFENIIKIMKPKGTRWVLRYSETI